MSGSGKVIKVSGELVLHKTNVDFCLLHYPLLWTVFSVFSSWGWHTYSWQTFQKKVLSLRLLPRRAQKSYHAWNTYQWLRNALPNTSAFPLSPRCCCFGTDLWISRTRRKSLCFEDMNCSLAPEASWAPRIQPWEEALLSNPNRKVSKNHVVSTAISRFHSPPSPLRQRGRWNCSFTLEYVFASVSNSLQIHEVLYFKRKTPGILLR